MPHKIWTPLAIAATLLACVEAGSVRRTAATRIRGGAAAAATALQAPNLTVVFPGHPHSEAESTIAPAPLVSYRTDTHANADSAEQSAAAAKAHLEHARDALKVTEAGADVIRATSDTISSDAGSISDLGKARKATKTVEDKPAAPEKEAEAPEPVEAGPVRIEKSGGQRLQLAGLCAFAAAAAGMWVSI
eukprot:TRINITY_DN124075_c0_g1_i1.p1 TRINITY_DN124075_c0_g1~~TRINITY_DN124075_c0_g1_i1.p1  ORF type:complete len:190 (-),score=48.17 TRINITY_DN124075_c0_g1_i1:86-655(-)